MTRDDVSGKTFSFSNGPVAAVLKTSHRAWGQADSLQAVVTLSQHWVVCLGQRFLMLDSPSVGG